MIEKLIIEKFGPLKSIEIDLNKILILIGPQSTGKSTIAKLVTILRNFDFVMQDKTFLEALNDHNIKSYLKKNTFIKYASDSYTFTYQKGKGRLVKNKNHKLNKVIKEYIEFEKKNPRPSIEEHRSKFAADLKRIGEELNGVENELNSESEEIKKQEDLISRLRVQVKELVGESTLLSQREVYLDSLTNEILKYTNYSVYIPAERMLIPIISNFTLSLIQNEIPIPKILLDYGANFEKAREEFKNYKVDFLNIRYKYIKNENRLYFNSKEYILLSEASSGLQSIIPLILVILLKNKETNGGNTYVIEEPELNLFPKNQYYLAKILASNCCGYNKVKESYNELIITTHSPYFLTSFNNFLLANKIGEDENLELDVDKIISKESWVSSSNFNAYYIDKRGATKIFNEKTGLISDNQLDNASVEIMSEFDQLMGLYSKKLRNARSN